MFNRFFNLNKGAEKSREGVFSRISNLFERSRPIDDELWDELEELLLEADAGVQVTDQLMEILRNEVTLGGVTDSKGLYKALQDELVDLLSEVRPASADDMVGPPDQLSVLLIIGVNGVGKTTTIAKLAKYWKSHGRSVMLAAGDTFRAAAIDQLKIWGERVGVPVIAQHPGADPAAVVFDAVAAARARGANLLIVDTAGRLHTKSNLMDELRKVRRVLDRQEVTFIRSVLVLDAVTGQNGLVQGQSFSQAVGLDGLVIAKLDGTAKGGVVFAIVNELELPVLFVGTGEKVDDLSEFDPEAFVRALFK